MSASDREEGETPPLFTPSESTTSSKRSVLRKKLQAEKLALELKIAEQTFANEIECLRAVQQKRARLLELQKKAEESRLEYEFEDAIAQEEGMSNKGDIDEELYELPSDGVDDRVSRLDLEITENTVVEKPHMEEIKSTKPEVVTEISSEPRRKETCESFIAKGEAELKTSATGDPSVQTSKMDQLFEKMLPAFVKIVKPNVQKFNGNPLEYSKFKAAFNVEVDKKEVYDATEKLKFLLDSVEGSAKSCLAKFMPGSDRYEEAWTALQERFGRVDTVVSAAKKRIDQFPTIVKENSV